jgi:hypothetical protein
MAAEHAGFQTENEAKIPSERGIHDVWNDLCVEYDNADDFRECP